MIGWVNWFAMFRQKVLCIITSLYFKKTNFHRGNRSTKEVVLYYRICPIPKKESFGFKKKTFSMKQFLNYGRLSRSVLSIFIKRWTIFFYMSCHEFPMKISHCSNPRLSIVTPLVQVFQRHSFAKALILHPLMRAGQQSISLRSTFQYISDTL